MQVLKNGIDILTAVICITFPARKPRGYETNTETKINDINKMKVQITESQMSMFKNAGNIVGTLDKKYYFIPFWLEVLETFVEDGSVNYVVMLHKLGNLPDDLTQQINEMREISCTSEK